MENKNGSGIFLGVVSVATLIVAIVGATFAYFSTTVNGNEGAVTAGSADLATSLGLNEITDLRTNMIPLAHDLLDDALRKQGAKGTGEGICEGYSSQGGNTVYNVCSLYQFELTNSADVAQTVHVSFNTVQNGFENLKYCVYDGAMGASTKELVACKKVPTTSDKDIFSVTLPETNGSHTYTVALYVEENGDQTAADGGKSFAGTITASTGAEGAGVTGVMTAVGA